MKCSGIDHARPAEERFWEKVDRNGPVPEHRPELGNCWTWTASTFKDGYGAFAPNGILGRAHRFSWEIHFGHIPEKELILHKCDNPLCVRPDHFFSGNHKSNMIDKVDKGRQSRGDSHYFSKLTDALVLEIRRRYVPRKVSQNALALEYGVSQHTVNAIILRKTWKHI